MKSVYDELFKIKEFRENSASNDVRLKRSALEEAHQTLLRREREFADYRTWREGREVELYDEIVGSLVRVGDLDDLKEKIFRLREKERLLQEKVKEAEQARQTAMDLLDQSIAAHRQAMRDKEKFAELRDIARKELKKEEERAEDMEMEEFTGTPPDLEMGEQND